MSDNGSIKYALLLKNLALAILALTNYIKAEAAYFEKVQQEALKKKREEEEYADGDIAGHRITEAVKRAIQMSKHKVRFHLL